MNLDKVLAVLERHASLERKQRVARLGIPEESSIGVAVPDIRRTPSERADPRR